MDLELDPSTMTLFVNGTLICDAEGKYQEHCNTYYWWDYVNAAYTSANPAIATITSDGLVTGRSGGSTTITGTYTDIYYTYSSTLQDCVEHDRNRSAPGSCKVKPKITSVTPPRGLIGVSTSVTIAGSGFGTNPTVSAGTGITVTRGTFSDTQIHATFAVASNAPSGNHSVTVSTTQGTSNSVNFYVQVPTFFVVTANVTSTEACTYNGNPGTTYHRKLTYQVQDQATPTHQPIAVSGMSVGEHICNQNDGCQLGGLLEGFWTTDSTGKITPPDDVFMCSAVTRCPGCIETWNQDFSVSNNSGGQWYPTIVNGATSGAGNSVSMACSQYPSVTPGGTDCH
jgi:hypothetical protein